MANRRCSAGSRLFNVYDTDKRYFKITMDFLSHNGAAMGEEDRREWQRMIWKSKADYNKHTWNCEICKEIK